jgi:PAS domain S-box-containing protein
MGEFKIIVPPIAKPAWTRVAGESLERLGVAPRALQNYLSYVVIVFLVYLIAGKLGQATTNIRSSNLGPVWPAYGVAVAAILLCGYRVWIGIAGAAFLVALLSPVPLMAAVGQAAGATVAALTGALLLYRIARFDPSLSRLRDAVALIVFGALSSAIVSATVGVSVLYATHLHAYSGLGSAWLIYWLGDSTGVLLVTPLVLTFPRLLKIGPGVRVAEFAVLLVVLTAICFIIFGNLLSSTEGDMFAFVVLPFVMWGAIRFGLSGAALATLVIATIATLGTALGHGPFAQSSPFVNAVLLDVYFAVLSASGMTLAAVIAERERAERQREQLVREQAAMETRLQLSAIVRSSDERFHLAAQAGRMYAYEWDAATDMVTRSEGCLNILGLSSSETQLTRQQFSAKVHPDDRALFVSADRDVTPENPTSKISYRVIRSDGCVVWVERNACAFFDEQGRLQRMVGMVADITERKRAEEALAGVSGKLITAQEHERTRIARELHDDIAQRLALLANELQQFREDSPNLPEVRKRVEELEKQTCEIASDIHSLSHELHSSKLEYLGMVPAMRSYCSEFSKQQKLEINFKNHDLPSTLPPAVSLCLFRVLQEALHNSAKYSGAKYIDVELRAMPNEIGLTVSDSGEGFDLKAAREGLGLGLISMEERLKVVGGDLLIESQPKHGTTIQARVPLRLENKAMHAAG